MTEVEFPKPPKAVSSGCWSLGSNQYPSGRFPKVSIAIQVDKENTGTSPNLSQEKPPEEQIEGVSQRLASKRPPPWISPHAMQKENLNPNVSDRLLGKRKEPVQEGDAAGTSGLKLKLWEILGAGSQKKDAIGSPIIGKDEAVKKFSQNQNGVEKENTGTLKLSQNNSEKVKLRRECPSSDPIETDSGSMKQAHTRRVTRSLTRTQAPPQVTINQGSRKTEPVKKTEVYNFSFDEAEPKQRGAQRKDPAGGSSTLPKGTNGARKRARIEPRRINFPQKPLVSGKNSKETSTNENLSCPSKEHSASRDVSYQREKTVSHNSEIPKKHFLQPEHGARSSLRKPLPVHTNRADKENEHSWEFPVTPPTSTEEPQEKGILNPRNDRNPKGSVEFKQTAFVKHNKGFSTQRRESVQKPISAPNYNGVPQRKKVPSQSTDRNTNVLGCFKTPPSVKTVSGVCTRSRKPVELLACPVTSNVIQSEKYTSTNRSLSSAFAKPNMGASTQSKPIELVASPITSNEVQPEKEASASRQRNGADSSVSPVVSNHIQPERDVGATRRIFLGDSKGTSSTVKLNVGAFTPKSRIELMASPATSNDVQPEKDTHTHSRSCDFDVATYAQRKQVEFHVSPVTSNEVQPEKDGDSPLPDGDINMSDYFKSPTFAMNDTSSSQRRKTTQEEALDKPSNSSSQEEALDKPSDFKTSENSRSVSDSGSDSDAQLSDDTRDSRNMSEKKSLGIGVEKEAEKLSHPTPVKVLETESSNENGFFRKGYRRTDELFSSSDTPIEQSLPVKIRTREKAVKTEVKKSYMELSPPTPICSPGKESNGSKDILDQFSDNTLASAVSEFANVLQKIKSKIKTQKNKKSSEILSIATEKIEKQLKDAEIRMQEDSRKLIGSSKSKRKQLESKFQEHAEKLKMIHDKFREEVSQHLMDCNNSLNEFEAFHVELKGTSEKQKGQHRKLLRHVEEGIEAQLTDAETKITRVQKEAQKKMNGLKHVLRGWIAEGAT